MRQSSLITALLAVLALGVATGAKAADRLKPCRNERPQPYDARVDELLRKAVPEEAVWTLRVMPSFSPEWGVRGIREGDEYRIVVVQFESSLWAASYVETGPGQFKFDPSIADARAIVTERKLSAQVFQHLEAEIRHEIEAAESNDDFDFVMHGVSFHLRTASGGCAETTDFSHRTQAGRLMRIFLELCGRPSEKKLLRMLDRLQRQRP